MKVGDLVRYKVNGRFARVVRPPSQGFVTVEYLDKLGWPRWDLPLFNVELIDAVSLLATLEDKPCGSSKSAPSSD